MDAETTKSVVEWGLSLATLISSKTVAAINVKIQNLKKEKNADTLRSNYDEFITIIAQERAEAIRLAQLYKSELEKISISDKDIEQLQNTIARILSIFMQMQTVNIDPNDTVAVQKAKNQENSFKAISELINTDTLKTMQLLGFNYKAAIGEPLTEICAEAIRNFAKNRTKQQQSLPPKRK